MQLARGLQPVSGETQLHIQPALTQTLCRLVVLRVICIEKLIWNPFYRGERGIYVICSSSHSQQVVDPALELQSLPKAKELEVFHPTVPNCYSAEFYLFIYPFIQQ